MQKLLLLSFVIYPFLIGCSGKQYFNPKETYEAKVHAYGGNIVDLSRNGATLKNGSYIGKDGINKKIKLKKGFRFLSENNRYALSSNSDGVLHIIDKKSATVLRAVALHVPIVSASISNGLIAYILNNNTFGLYQIKDNKKIFENRSERTFAIDTRAASPIFIDNIVVMPMLDGKLIIVDTHNSENTTVVYLSSAQVFNNVIFLSRIDNTMVSATPHKVITISNQGKKEYRANISEVAISNDSIYLFTKEGEILRLNKVLGLLSSNKFKFAHFSVATTLEGKVFGLDQQGYLIVLSPDLTKYKIYNLGEIEHPAFITGNKLYKDGKIINLSTLGYE